MLEIPETTKKCVFNQTSPTLIGKLIRNIHRLVQNEHKSNESSMFVFSFSFLVPYNCVGFLVPTKPKTKFHHRVIVVVEM